MRYMLLIYSDEAHYPKMTEQQATQLMVDYRAFTEELQAASALLGSDRLQPTSSATTIRVRGGDTVTTDGPFAETKEQLGGFYLIEARDLDEAIQWATKVPTARYGSVEVRPIWDMSAD